jgi:hypothetical protein
MKNYPPSADYWSLTVTYSGKEEVVPIAKQGEFYIENIPIDTYRHIYRHMSYNSIYETGNRA